MSRRMLSIPRVVGLTSAMLLVSLMPPTAATAVEPWRVELGSPGAVLAGGAGASFPLAVTCPAGYPGRKSLYLESSVGSYHLSFFPCDGTANTINAVLFSGSVIAPGTVTATVTIRFWNVSGDYEGSVTDTGDVTLTEAPVRLDWTPIIQIGSATVDEAQVVTVPVAVKCEEGEQDLHVDRGVQVALYQRDGNVVIRGYGSIYDEAPECDGRLHRVDVPVIYGLRDDYPPFGPGEALATAAVVLCTYRGPFTCERVEEAAEIRIHP